MGGHLFEVELQDFKNTNDMVYVGMAPKAGQVQMILQSAFHGVGVGHQKEKPTIKDTYKFADC